MFIHADSRDPPLEETKTLVLEFLGKHPEFSNGDPWFKSSGVPTRVGSEILHGVRVLAKGEEGDEGVDHIDTNLLLEALRSISSIKGERAHGIRDGRTRVEQ